MGGSFEDVGVAFLSSTKRSVKFEPGTVDRYFDPKPFFASVKDLNDLLNGRKQTITIWRPKEEASC